MTNLSQEELLSPSQIERRARLSKYNRLTLYLPLVLMGVFISAVIGIMMWLTVFPAAETQTDWRTFASGTADMIIIFTVLFLILGVALIPISAAVWIWYTWQNPRPVERWLQKWLSKSDTLLERTNLTVAERGEQVANASIHFNASARRVGRTLERLAAWIIPARWMHEEEKSK
ncbi:MAG: hypothetical protein AAGD96_01375 [Chloroflexota bacterium]